MPKLKKQEVIEAELPPEVAEAFEAIKPAGSSLAIVQRPIEYLRPVMDLDTAKARLLEFQQYVKFYLREGEDYGVIPGTTKPTLLQPGADKLCEIYGLAPTFPDARIKRTERWDLEPALFDYETTCVLVHKATGIVVSEGLGSCNSWETKYRWRDQSRKCPVCGKETIIKGKAEYGGGWLCFAKKGGCGAKFMDNDPKIVDQPIGRVPNDAIADIKNTILKMSKKRAKIDATIAATRSSGIFTQDMENISEPERVNGNGDGNGHQVKAAASAAAPQPQSVGFSETDNTMPTDEIPTLNDYKEWLPNCRKLKELSTIFAEGYKQFYADSQAQAELRRIYEARKIELGGEANPEGKTKKQEAKNGTNGRN